MDPCSPLAARIAAARTAPLLNSIRKEMLQRNICVIACRLHPVRFDEVGVLCELFEFRYLAFRAIISAGGAIVRQTRKWVIATFETATLAIEGSVLCCKLFLNYNSSAPYRKRLCVSIGVASGDVLVGVGKHGDGFVLGKPVQTAELMAKLTAKTIVLISADVRKVAKDYMTMSVLPAESLSNAQQKQLQLHIEIKKYRDSLSLSSQSEPAPLPSPAGHVYVVSDLSCEVFDAHGDIELYSLHGTLNSSLVPPSWLILLEKAERLPRGIAIKKTRQAASTALDRTLMELLLLLERASETDQGMDEHEIQNAIVTRFSRETTLVVVALAVEPSKLIRLYGDMHYVKQMTLLRALLYQLPSDFTGQSLAGGFGVLRYMFDSVQDAVSAALDVYRIVNQYNAELHEKDQILVNVGVHHGTVFFHRDEVFGYDALLTDYIAVSTDSASSGPFPTASSLAAANAPLPSSRVTTHLCLSELAYIQANDVRLTGAECMMVTFHGNNLSVWRVDRTDKQPELVLARNRKSQRDDLFRRSGSSAVASRKESRPSGRDVPDRDSVTKRMSMRSMKWIKQKLINPAARESNRDSELQIFDDLASPSLTANRNGSDVADLAHANTQHESDSNFDDEDEPVLRVDEVNSESEYEEVDGHAIGAVEHDIRSFGSVSSAITPPTIQIRNPSSPAVSNEHLPEQPNCLSPTSSTGQQRRARPPTPPPEDEPSEEPADLPPAPPEEGGVHFMEPRTLQNHSSRSREAFMSVSNS
eukprot:c4684_g1_i1.p1 GENE.c4684_g1_i1~~c4684_g1_i1.p1  ORF type:complete len:757 (-),score=141.38 c4684_g1_i1:60-2330(-)